MAALDEHCGKELDSSSPFNVSYFTLYLTRGIEILEYYTKVPFYHVLLEAILVIWIIRLILSKSYRPQEQILHLTEKEEEELIEEWEPEPLVPSVPPYDKEILSPRVVEGKPSHMLRVEGKQCLNLATFNFLGFVGNKQIEDAAVRSLQKYGVGSCGPRGFYGTIDVHLELEQRVAQFMNTEEAILYSYGFSTIASAIPAYSKRGDVIFCDKGVCFAIQKGVVASRSKVMWFEHNDMEDLERLLKEQQDKDRKNPSKAKVTRRFLIVEGLYMNYGDIAPLPQLVKLKKQYKVRIFIDESLSFGVLGKTGRGLTEHFDIPLDDVDLVSVSMENSLATIGGFCFGTSFVVDHQRLSGAGYCFSASLPPLLASAAIEALSIIEKKPVMFDELRQKAVLFRDELKGIQGLLPSGFTESPVIHLRVAEPTTYKTQDERNEIYKEEELRLQRVVDLAFADGIAITLAKYLKKDEMFLPRPSIRITINLLLSDEELRTAAQVLKDAASTVFS